MIIVIPLCSIFIIVGSWFCLKGIRSCLIAHKSKTWVPVECEVISSNIEETRGSDGDPMFKAIVNYQYGYDGNNIVGDKIYFGYSSSSDKEDALVIQQNLTKGKKITAYINPDNPKDAVLVPGIHRFTLINVFMGTGFAFMGVWFLILWYLFSGGKAGIFHKTIGMG